MKKSNLLAGAGALAVLVGAVALAMRPGNDPVAAVQPAPSVVQPAASGPAVARLGNQQVAPEELKALFATLPPESREQLRGNRAALES
ncbi:peptidylprolyl isomerase, partial [Pseudomonas gingeri]|nr:peptidylprolyl isomerase [Pseudomonas gingeri]